MKKFFIYIILILAVLGTIFTYVLYTEGFFEKAPEKSDLKPFEMKCQAGKCASGKCAGDK